MKDKDVWEKVINYEDSKGSNNQTTILNFGIRLRNEIYSGSLIPISSRVTVEYSYEKKSPIGT